MHVGTWNIGSLSGKKRGVCGELRKRLIYVCFSGVEMERTGFYDAGNGWNKIHVVMGFRKRWSWWCGSNHEGGAV